jgi:putative endonuclease
MRDQKRFSSFLMKTPKKSEESPSENSGRGDPSLCSGLVSVLVVLDLFMPPVAYVYILTNLHHTVVYVGMTTNLRTRLWEHQQKLNPQSFTARYNVFKPVFYQGFTTEEEAEERERFIKGKNRKWKNDLVHSANPEWMDLTEEIMSMKA